jgi:2-polyprenyl-6-methoxyphenol hydroxylase-like FAD-dependent oxidoreductase
MPPRETVVDAFPGYSSRIYQRPPAFNEPWQTMYVIPSPPDSPRGGVIIPMEGERWLVTLVGIGRDYPPVDPASYLEFARSLPGGRFYEALAQASPLTRPYGFRRTENRLRHYDKLPRYLDGFLVAGDGVCALNPIHAQGMTVAAMSSLALERCLREAASLTGLAHDFQRELGQMVAGPWQMATSTDHRWPTTKGAQKALDPLSRLHQTYFTWVLQAMLSNSTLAERFFQVQHMVAPVSSLFQPDIVSQVLKATPTHLQQTVDIRPLLETTQKFAA